MDAIGVDMGGTKIEASLITPKGKILKSVRVPTEPTKGKKHVLDTIARAINEVKRGKIKGVGISMPGFVDDHGVVVFSGGTLRLAGVNIVKEIKKRVKLPVFAENDANCFALAEAAFGAAKKYNHVIGIIWGTGVGGGIVINKHVYKGSFGGAGEFGHIVVDPSISKGKKCNCGQRGCVEQLSSGKNISRRYKELGGKIKNATPREIYKSKEKVAKQVIKDAVHYLGLGISGLVDELNPDAIVLGGGVSNLPKPVYDALRKEVNKYALDSLTKKLKIVRHSISDSAGGLGAAALVFEQ